jgi:hypothetical protein
VRGGPTGRSLQGQQRAGSLEMRWSVAQVTCPNCAGVVRVSLVGIPLFVRCPWCSRVFPAEVDAQPDTPTPSAREPLFSPPHLCQHCHRPLAAPIGRPATTAVCPNCQNKTPVYAVLHACPSCGALLESPSRSSGTDTTCPACKNSLRVPADVLLKEPPLYSDELRFAFSCPACRCDVVSRTQDVGRYAVCPHCRVSSVVPRAGSYLERGQRPPSRGPLEGLYASTDVTCPNCHTRFPARAVRCPICGARTPPPASW